MILIVTLMVLLALLQVPQIIIKQEWGELAAYSVLWAAALAYALLIHADAPIPNPTEVIHSLVTRLYNLAGIEI